MTSEHRISVPIRLTPRHRRWVLGCFATLWVSGVLWLLFHYFLAVPGAFGPRPHMLENWWLRLHGLAMMAALVVIGTTWIHHAHKAWRLDKNRVLGGAIVAYLAWLAATGYALYYFSSDANEPWLPLLHWVPGLALPAIGAAHILAGRKQTAARRSADPAIRERFAADVPARN